MFEDEFWTDCVPRRKCPKIIPKRYLRSQLFMQNGEGQSLVTCQTSKKRTIQNINDADYFNSMVKLLNNIAM